MNDSDIHGLSGAYAIDALDDLERAQFTRHLARCSECRAEVESLREAAALLAGTTALEPPADLRGRVLAGIKTVRPLPPTAEQSAAADVADAPAVTTARHPRRLRGLVAAAAVVGILGAGGAVWHPWSDDSSQAPVLSAAERVRNAPDAQTVSHRFDQGGEATVVASKSLSKFVVTTRGLPPLPEGKIYEMWLQDADQGMLPAGLMTARDATVVLDGDVANAVGAGITVEPAGGSHVPTSDPVALFSFENA